jgi:hypothetical protein
MKFPAYDRFFQAGKGISATPSFITARTSTDFSFLYVITDVGFTPIGVQRKL